MMLNRYLKIGTAIFSTLALTILGFGGVAQTQPSAIIADEEIVTVEGVCIEYGWAISTGYMVWIMTDTSEVYSFFMEYSNEPEEGTQLGSTVRVKGTIEEVPVEVNYTVLSPIEVWNIRPIAKPAIGDIDERWVGEEVELQTIIRVVEDIDGGKIITVEDWWNQEQFIRTLWIEGETYTYYRYEEWGPWSPENTPEPGFYIQSIYGVVVDWNGEVVVKALIV
jgi:hypothetical protein